jgi:hypothetical protein
MNLVLHRMKQGARTRNLPWSIDDEEVRRLVIQPCHWCDGVSPSGINGLDRVDNTHGYTLTNVVPSCSTCNMMRRTLGVREFIEQCILIARKHQ